MTIHSDLDLKITKRLDYDRVDSVWMALSDAFHPDGLGDGDVDERFAALWTLFLHSVGWTEEEYWAEEENHHDECPSCQEPLEDHDDDLDSEPLNLPIPQKKNDKDIN